jgi:hypothetical protein
MKPQTLRIYQADPETGEMRPRKRLEKKIEGDNLDEAMAKARAYLKQSGLTRIRSINAAPDNILIAYCEAPEMVAETVGGLEIRRPARVRPREEG